MNVNISNTGEREGEKEGERAGQRQWEGGEGGGGRGEGREGDAVITRCLHHHTQPPSNTRPGHGHWATLTSSLSLCVTPGNAHLSGSQLSETKTMMRDDSPVQLRKCYKPGQWWTEKRLVHG